MRIEVKSKIGDFYIINLDNVSHIKSYKDNAVVHFVSGLDQDHLVLDVSYADFMHRLVTIEWL